MFPFLAMSIWEAQRILISGHPFPKVQVSTEQVMIKRPRNILDDSRDTRPRQACRNLKEGYTRFFQTSLLAIRIKVV